MSVIEIGDSVTEAELTQSLIHSLLRSTVA